MMRRTASSRLRISTRAWTSSSSGASAATAALSSVRTPSSCATPVGFTLKSSRSCGLLKSLASAVVNSVSFKDALQFADFFGHFFRPGKVRVPLKDDGLHAAVVHNCPRQFDEFRLDGLRVAVSESITGPRVSDDVQLANAR